MRFPINSPVACGPHIALPPLNATRSAPALTNRLRFSAGGISPAASTSTGNPCSFATRITSANNGRGGASKALKELGDHPDGGGPVNVMDGRYGPYVKFAKINATIPKDQDPEKITMEQALILISEKAAKGKKKGKKK